MVDEKKVELEDSPLEYSPFEQVKEVVGERRTSWIFRWLANWPTH